MPEIRPLRPRNGETGAFRRGNTGHERDEEQCQKRTKCEQDYESRLHQNHVIPPTLPTRYAKGVPKPSSLIEPIFDQVGDNAPFPPGPSPCKAVRIRRDDRLPRGIPSMWLNRRQRRN
jgi:hypothetical protein